MLCPSSSSSLFLNCSSMSSNRYHGSTDKNYNIKTKVNIFLHVPEHHDKLWSVWERGWPLLTAHDWSDHWHEIAGGQISLWSKSRNRWTYKNDVGMRVCMWTSNMCTGHLSVLADGKGMAKESQEILYKTNKTHTYTPLWTPIRAALTSFSGHQTSIYPASRWCPLYNFHLTFYSSVGIHHLHTLTPQLYLQLTIIPLIFQLFYDSNLP